MHNQPINWTLVNLRRLLARYGALLKAQFESVQNWNHVASIPGCANHQPQLFLLPACYCGSTRNSLTPKPLKLLSILAKDGLTLKESAQKLCISVDTANKHVAAAKQSLGASTLANAVYLAATHDLLIEED